MICKDCKIEIPKSNPKWGHMCDECIRVYRREWGRKRRAMGLKSGGVASKEWWDKYNKEYYSRPDVKKRKAQQAKIYRDDPVKRFKHQARWAVNKALKAGKLFKQECVECGEPKSEAHHPDYNKPLLVVWLCRKCHRKHHKTKAEEV